jgi:hypothetical protein
MDALARRPRVRQTNRPLRNLTEKEKPPGNGGFRAAGSWGGGGARGREANVIRWKAFREMFPKSRGSKLFQSGRSLNRDY